MKRTRGSALVIVVVLAALTLLVIATAMTESTAAVQYAGQSAREARLRYACEAGLAYYRDQIAYAKNGGPPYMGAPTSASPPGPPFTTGSPPGYTGNANQWLRFYAPTNNYWQPLFQPRASASLLPQPSTVVGATATSAGIPVWVWVNDICLDTSGNPLPAGQCVAGDDYRMAAYAELPSSYDERANKVSAYDRILLIQDLRESQPFSSYMFFTFDSDLYIGNVTVSGSIHSNQQVIFPPTGNVTVTGKATAVGGFQNYPDNPGISLGASATGGPPVPLPATGVAQENNIALAGAGSTDPAPGPKFYSIKRGAGQFSGWNALSGPNIDAAITIHNDPTGRTFDVTATGSGGGSVTYTGVPFPDKGVIYVDGNVTVNAPNGFSGKLSIVAGNGDLTVGSDIRYKDPNPAVDQTTQAYGYNLVDPRTNTIVDPAAPGSWASYQYQPNPNYTGPPSALGLMAQGSVMSSAAAPNNLMLNASFYANDGSPFDAVSAGVAKGNLAIGGSLVGNTTGARTNTLVGYNTAGLYAFDGKSAKSPPPGWLSTPAPAFGAIYRRSPYSAPAGFIHDGTNTAASGAGN